MAPFIDMEFETFKSSAGQYITDPVGYLNTQGDKLCWAPGASERTLRLALSLQARNSETMSYDLNHLILAEREAGGYGSRIPRQLRKPKILAALRLVYKQAGRPLPPFFQPYETRSTYEVPRQVRFASRKHLPPRNPAPYLW